MWQVDGSERNVIFPYKIINMAVSYSLTLKATLAHTTEEMSALYSSVWVQWNLYTAVTLGPAFCGCNIEGGCIIEVHNTLAICTLGPNKVALLERLAAL